MILTIALGIVVGVLILLFLPDILYLGLWAIVIMVGAGLIFLGIAALETVFGAAPDWPGEVSGMAAVIVVFVALSWLASQR